jgi:probable O-glycosylation ligase (exosortase A-associated)
MKQLLFMIVVTFIGAAGTFVSPILGITVYYLFAVLRPQYLWQWSLPPEIPWSEYVAIATLVSTALYLSGFRQSAKWLSNNRPYGLAHGALFLFGVWVTVTYVTALDREVAWPWLLEYLKMFLMFFVSALLIRHVSHVWLLMVTAATALGYVAYEVNIEYMSSNYMGIYFNGYGGLDNNGAGLMLAMGVPLCLFIYLSTSRWWRWAFAALIPVLLHAVLLTFSRGAMVALLVTAPLMFFRGKHRGQLLLAATALAIVIPLMAGEEVRREFFSVEEYEEDGSAQSRFATWKAAFAIAQDYPVFGVGVRNSSLVSVDYGADSYGRVIHSQYLTILADNGYPGLFFYLLTLVMAAWSLRRVRKWARQISTQDARTAYAIACGVECSLAVFCVGGLFLALEVFELPYLLLLLSAQLPLALDLKPAVKPVPESPAPAPFSRPVPVVGRPRVARTGSGA